MNNNTIFGVKILSNIKESVFELKGTSNTSTGNMLVGVGPILKKGKYTINIFGRENLDYYYVQTKTTEHDYENFPTLVRLKCNQTYSFTLEETSKIRIGIGLKMIEYNDQYNILIQKEEMKNLNYIEYVEQNYAINLTGHEPLRKIGDVADYIDYANQRILRNVKSIVYTGTEKWYTWGDKKTDYYSFYCNLSKNAISKSTIISNQFVNNTYTNISNATTTGVTCANTYIGISIPRNYLSNVSTSDLAISSFKTWLASQYSLGTPVKVYYQLEQPEYEYINLPKISTFEGTTNITVNTEISPSNLLLKYTKMTK